MKLRIKVALAGDRFTLRRGDVTEQFGAREARRLIAAGYAEAVDDTPSPAGGEGDPDPDDQVENTPPPAGGEGDPDPDDQVENTPPPAAGKPARGRGRKAKGKK